MMNAGCYPLVHACCVLMIPVMLERRVGETTPQYRTLKRPRRSGLILPQEVSLVQLHDLSFCFGVHFFNPHSSRCVPLCETKRYQLLDVGFRHLLVCGDAIDIRYLLGLWCALFSFMTAFYLIARPAFTPCKTMKDCIAPKH
jgi:hypothetical protein